MRLFNRMDARWLRCYERPVSGIGDIASNQRRNWWVCHLETKNDNEDSDTWPCEPVLHMPSLRKDNVFQEYENEVVRIGCYTTTNDDGDFDIILNIWKTVVKWPYNHTMENTCPMGTLWRSWQIERMLVNLSALQVAWVKCSICKLLVRTITFTQSA